MSQRTLVMGSSIFQLLIILIFLMGPLVKEIKSWRRRGRRRCSPVNCRVSSWTPWSTCSALQCGEAGSQHRTRSVITSPLCGGSVCPSLQESQNCYGNTSIDCEYSAWSTWSECSRCGDTQTSSRHVTTIGECGGTLCNFTALNKTRTCQVHCLNKGNLVEVHCYCRSGVFSRCCLHYGRQLIF